MKVRPQIQREASRCKEDKAQWNQNNSTIPDTNGQMSGPPSPPSPSQKQESDLEFSRHHALVDWGWQQASELLRVGAGRAEPSPAVGPAPPTPTRGSAVSPPAQGEGRSQWITGPWFPGQERARAGQEGSLSPGMTQQRPEALP